MTDAARLLEPFVDGWGLRERFRLEATTVPDLPLEDAGWEDDDQYWQDREGRHRAIYDTRASGRRRATSARSAAATIPTPNAPASPASIEMVPASASATLAPPRPAPIPTPR